MKLAVLSCLLVLLFQSGLEAQTQTRTIATVDAAWESITISEGGQLKTTGWRCARKLS